METAERACRLRPLPLWALLSITAILAGIGGWIWWRHERTKVSFELRFTQGTSHAVSHTRGRFTRSELGAWIETASVSWLAYLPREATTVSILLIRDVDSGPHRGVAYLGTIKSVALLPLAGGWRLLTPDGHDMGAARDGGAAARAIAEQLRIAADVRSIWDIP